MGRQIYVNLPIKDVAKTRAFFSALGFQFDQKFSNDDALCMIVADDIYVMLLVEPFFKTFISKAICDAKTSTEVLVCLSCASRAELDEQIEKAVAAGGRILREPQDYGFMYSRCFEDLDGHIWELVYMNPDAAVSA